MSETSTESASTGESTGSAEVGTGASGVPAGYVPQADLDQLESRRRSLQSELDKERARIADLESRAKQSAPPAPQTVDIEAIGATVEARIARYHAMEDAKREAREKFPHAPAEVFKQSHSTPEELFAAAGDAHKRVEAERATMRADLEKELTASFAAKYGIEITPQTTETPAGDDNGGLTLERLASMSQHEYEAVPAEIRDRLMKGF